MKPSTVLKIALPFLLLVLIFALASPAQTQGSDNTVRVWVQFEPNGKAAVENALKASGAEFHYTFDNLDAFVVSLPQQAIEGLRHNPNVAAIEEDAVRQLYGQTVPYGIDMVQARDVWDADRDGVVDSGAPDVSKRVVCIIDSGVYTKHEDLQTVNFIGGYPTDWNNDRCGHGTHVTGTIAAANNTAGVVGVTPGGLNVYMVKVFGDDCSWTYSSTLADAANKCQAAGANVISMSLGGTTKSTFEQATFDSLNSAGILSIAAAGNDGNTRVSYPAGYASVMSVAAVDSGKTVASFSQQNSDVEIAAPGVGVLSTVPWISNHTLSVGGNTYSGGGMEFAAEGTASGTLVDGGICDSTGVWSGKVVLCQRGTIDFYTKVTNVQKGGGTAAVIYNNVSGDFSGTLGAGNSSMIPAISLSMENGALAKTYVGQPATVVSTTTYNSTGGYEAWDGTSMATPHVSAVAALIWAANPSWTNTQIRTALDNSAQDLGTAGRDNAYGYGLVQAKAALDYAKANFGGSSLGALSVSVTTSAATYANGNTAVITVTVKDNAGIAVSGATVNLTITTANGKKATGSATTNSSGVATFNYKINAKIGGTGTYSVSATAAKTGYTGGVGTTTFTAK